MIKQSLILPLFFAFLLPLQAQHLSSHDASRAVPGAEQVWIKDHLLTPAYVRLDEVSRFPISQFETYFAKTFQVDAAYGLTFLREEKDPMGHRHLRYQQTYLGKPVESSMIIAHTHNGQVYAINGDFFDLSQVTMERKLAEGDALQAALKHIGANAYKWQIPQEEERLQEIMRGNADYAGPYTYYPQGELVVVAKNAQVKKGDFRLAWKFDIYAHAPMGRTYTYVDAQTGEILWDHNRLHTADVQGVAVTRYSGTQPITMDSTGVNSFRLRDNSRGDGIHTLDLNQGTSTGNAVDFVDIDKRWDPTTNLDDAAGDAHWGAEMTYDYFLSNYGRNSIDDNGFRLTSYVHYGQNIFNAFWDGTMNYGDGNNSPLTSLDVAGHEIAHGLTNFTANLIYANEPGALNESFSDIFGKSVEFFARPNNFSWRLGADFGRPLRDMQNPLLFGNPRNYLGNSWYTGTGDNGGVHFNSGVQNHWFYLLVTGGSGTNDFGDAYHVTAIGIDTAAAIAYRNLTVYLTPSSEYFDARFYSIQSAIDLYGPCGSPHRNVADAWYAVGVGTPFSINPIAAIGAVNPQTCSYPYTIDFLDKSQSSGAWTWYFGDGDSSKLANPSHNYPGPGQYTVQLKIDGICGGKDDITQTNYVTVLPAPASPMTRDTSSFCGTPITLVAQSSHEVRWFSKDGFFIQSGDTLNLPGLSRDASYLAVAAEIQASQSVGRPDNLGGTGGFVSADNRHMLFDVFRENILHSVKVYASGTGPRVIEYRGSDGTVLQSRTVVIPDGESRVILDFPLQTGINQQLAVRGTVNLFGNNSNLNFPYEIPGIISITGSNASIPTGFYFFFYDWEVRDPACRSEPDTFTIKVTGELGPTIADAQRCGPGRVTFATQDSNLSWYDANGIFLTNGDTFTSPPLMGTTTFLVEKAYDSPSQKLGPLDKTFGVASYHNLTNEAHLTFTVHQPINLISVWVDAGSAGIRGIELRDGTGGLLQVDSVMIPSGPSRLQLDYSLQPGQYRIGGANMDLAVTSGAPLFPYQILGIVSIDNSSRGQGSYFYFYDWEIQPASCFSEPTTVTAIINPGPSASFSFTQNLSTFNFQDDATGTTPTTWTWDFGDGNTDNVANPTHTYLAVGTYTVVLTTSDGNCSNIDSQTVVVTHVTSIDDLLTAGSLKLYPNPGHGQFIIEADLKGSHTVNLTIYNSLGQRIYAHQEVQTASFREEVSLDQAAPGTYFIQLQVDGEVVTKKYVLMR